MTKLEDRDRELEDDGLSGDEIDLRQVLQVILRQWPWIVLTTLVTTLVAAAISFFGLSPSYEATALVAITPPQYVMQLSPGFEAVAQERIQTEIYGTYPELARSDELLQEVVTAVNQASGNAVLALPSLRSRALVEGSKGVGLIYLHVTHTDRHLAATIVNQWAELYVSTLNRLYGGEAGDHEFFVEQMAQAQSDLVASQEALAEFKARDLTLMLERKLAVSDVGLIDRLSRRDEIGLLLQDIRGWQDQLVSQDPSDTLSQGDELTAVLLQLKAFDVLMSDPPVPSASAEIGGQYLQSAGVAAIQVTIGQLEEGRTVGDQLASLGSLESWLEARAIELDTQIAGLQPAILRLQNSYQEATNEGERLVQQVDIATSLYESLALKAEESRIALESQTGVGRLASKAAVPTTPVGPRKLFNTVAGAGLGLLAGLALAVFREFSSRGRQPTDQGNPGDGR